MNEFETEKEVGDKWFAGLTEERQDVRRPIMKFGNDDEAEHYEVACEECMEQFRWSQSDRSILDRAFDFQLNAEKYEVLNWQRSAGQFGSGEWLLYQEVKKLHSRIENATGPYELDGVDQSAVLGTLRLAFAANILSATERQKAVDVYSRILSFRSHLFNDHKYVRKFLPDPDDGKVIGDFTLNQAIKHSPRLLGKGPEAIEDFFAELIEENQKRAIDNPATCHLSRGSREDLTDAACIIIVDSMKTKIAEWRELLAEADCVAKVEGVSTEIHNHLFFLDEQIGLGNFDPSRYQLTPDGPALLGVLTEIEDLVDWNACPALSNCMEKQRQAIDFRF